jgi:hypothetical protein
VRALRRRRASRVDRVEPLQFSGLVRGVRWARGAGLSSGLTAEPAPLASLLIKIPYVNIYSYLTLLALSGVVPFVFVLLYFFPLFQTSRVPVHLPRHAHLQSACRLLLDESSNSRLTWTPTPPT